MDGGDSGRRLFNNMTSQIFFLKRFHFSKQQRSKLLPSSMSLENETGVDDQSQKQGNSWKKKPRILEKKLAKIGVKESIQFRDNVFLTSECGF